MSAERDLDNPYTPPQAEIVLTPKLAGKSRFPTVIFWIERVLVGVSLITSVMVTIGCIAMNTIIGAIAFVFGPYLQIVLHFALFAVSATATYVFLFHTTQKNKT